MIGGSDIYIEISAGTPAVDFAIRAIRLYWPHAVFENANAEGSATEYEKLDFSNLTEVMAYKDLESAKAWDVRGAEPELDGTMIHLKRSGKHLAVVVDAHPSVEIQRIVETISLSLKKAMRTILLREAA